MAFNVFLFFAFISCACGFSGPTARPLPSFSSRFAGSMKTACEANSDTVEKNDACTGCFTKYYQQTKSPDALSLLARCGQTYLTAEPYSECVVTNGTENTNVYCNFEKCIQRLSSTDLVVYREKGNDEQINQCLKEAREISDTVNATLIINVVKCILAKHRCLPDSNYIPFPNAPPRSNALFVDGDNQIQVAYNIFFDQGTSPCTYGPNAYSPTPTQPGWPSAQCNAKVTFTPGPVPVTTTGIGTDVMTQ